MTLDEAMECDAIPLRAAVRELKKHGHDVEVRLGPTERAIYATCEYMHQDGQIVTELECVCLVDKYGCVNGGDVLGWLGY